MKLIRFYDIDWCIDSDDTEVGFPTEIILDLNFSNEYSDEEIEDDINEYGADYLSDETGDLVNGFSFEIIN